MAVCCPTSLCAPGLTYFPGNGTSVCNCWGDESAVVLREPGRADVRVPFAGTSWPNILAGEIDLDGDGARELVVALHRSSSNGISLMYYTVIIFDGKDRDIRLSFSTTGWGVAATDNPAIDPMGHDLVGMFSRAGTSVDASYCAVAPASMEGLRDPVLGDGNYMAQRLFRYRRGELYAHAGLDLRVLRIHAAARLEGWPSEARHWCEADSASAAITIESVDTSEPDGLRARVRTKVSGAVRDVNVARMLDGCSGMYFPENYRPAHRSVFRGRSAQLLCATDEDQDTHGYPIRLDCL